jgi:isoquinoline 1-oxidoreductase alpha subunit
MIMAISLVINGKQHLSRAEPDTPLLWVLRDELGLTGTKYGCGTGDCGICTVLIDDAPQQSCQWSLARMAGRSVVTIEGIQGNIADAVRKAWRQVDLAECGYCQSGQIITAVALLAANPTPDDSDLDKAFAGVLCRCMSYLGIRSAVYRAAALLHQ